MAIFCNDVHVEGCQNCDEVVEEEIAGGPDLGWLQLETSYQQMYLMAHSIMAGKHGFGKAVSLWNNS